MDVIDTLEDVTDEIEMEEDVMEEHENKKADITISLKSISSSAPTTSSKTAGTIKTESKGIEVQRRRLADVEANIRRINSKMVTVTPELSLDRCLLEQCHKQVNVFEMRLLDISHSIASIKDAKELPDEKSPISDAIFSIGLKISKSLSPTMEASTKPVREGIRLMKITVPTFDGDILQWRSFWEQFELYVHNRAELSDALNLHI